MDLKLCINFTLFILLPMAPGLVQAKNQSFTIDYNHNTFLMDGQKFRYISGSIHYMRVHPDLWRDRLTKIRAAGFNAIQFYIEWNHHEPSPGTYAFRDRLNFLRFMDIAHDLGLYIILR